MKRKLLIALPLLAGVLFMSEMAYTKLTGFTTMNRANDPIGTGIPSVRSCAGCHSDAVIKADDMTERIFLFDTGQTNYIPEQKYTIKYRLYAAQTCGFTTTVLDSATNGMAGTLESDDSTETKVYLHAASGRSYVNHVVGATTGGMKEYSFSWTAPAAGKGTVVFYFSSLSSNNDDTQDGDTVYNNTYMLTEGSLTGLAKVQSNVSVNIFPNPATDRIDVALNAAQAGTTVVSLISLDGKVAMELFHGQLSSGNHNLNFDLSGKVNTGVYFLRVNNAGKETVQKVLFN